HPVGDVYQQVRALVKLCHDLANLSPNFLIWPNAGNWIEFMPKLTWFTPNVYLTDPHLREYSPSLSFHKLLGDTRREQMVSVHDRYFVPWRNYTNCEYYAFPASRLHDHRVFEYSFLQGLAVTPNICPAETRTFLNRVPAVLHPKFIAFMRKWMSFIAENFDVWKHTARIGDAPGSGSVEIYSHILEDHGFICLVNQNSFPTTARFHLDGTSGLSKGEKFEIEDVYPQSCRAAEQPLPFAAWGDEINCEIQPYSVRFLKIKPFVVSDEIKVGGLPSKITETETGYRLTLRAPQGKGVLLSVALPDGQELESVSSRQTPTVPMYEFPVKAAQVIEQKQNYAFIQVNFPREEAPRSLTHWSVSDLNKQASDAVEVELPQLSQCNFLGGLVHGAFIEELEVQLDLQIKSVFAPSDDLASRIHPPQSKSEIPSATYPKATHQRFSTELHLPFIEKQIYGVQPDSSDDAILELAFSNPASVKNIRAFYNGDPIEVRRYIYSKRPEKDWYSFYIDLTGQVEMGSVKLDVDIEWSDKISVLTE
ncbi:MAG: hypothetical protein ABI210_00500, partial [Abditibacteriaceae bacterium]